MARFKYGNHNDVLNFGKFLIDNHLDKLNELCPFGSNTNRQSVIDGIDILCRLGNHDDRNAYADIVETSLQKLEKELAVGISSRDFIREKDLDIVKSIYFESNMRSITNGY